MAKQRLGTMFHETFPLTRAAISQVLKALSTSVNSLEETQSSVYDLLRQNTHLGPNYVKAMPRYAFGSGLTDSKYQLTLLGKYVHQFDPLLKHTGTQWLMHYHLSASHGPGPAFWHDLAITRFRSGEKFSADEIANQIAQFYEKAEGKTLASRSARATASIFLGTYSKPDGLGDLGILRPDGVDQYEVLEPESPPVWAVAWALLDYWKARSNNLVTINLSDLYGETGLTGLFMMGQGRLNSMLEQLQQEGILELHLIASPYQVLMLCSDMEPVLKKLYGNNRS